MLSPFSFSVVKNVSLSGLILGTTVSLRSTHCARCSLDRCAYFCTISGVDHPPNSCNTCNGVSTLDRIAWGCANSTISSRLNNASHCFRIIWQAQQINLLGIIFRAFGLSLLGISNSHIEKDHKNFFGAGSFADTACERLLRFLYLMTATHLSECGKEKLKTGTSFPRIRGIQSVPSLQQGFSCGRSAAEVKPTRQSRWFKQNAFLSSWIALLRSQ